MKTMKLIYPLAMALAVTLAGAGCKHQPTKLTPLPSSPNPVVGGDTQPITVPGNPPGIPLPPPEPPSNINPNPFPPINPANPPGPIAASTNWDPVNMIEDRGALALDTVHFAFDSAVVRDNEQGHLQAVAAALTSDPNVKLMIEGNCDERGTQEYNRSLGERRALALREALAKLGIDAQRVRTISFGKDKPVDTGHTEEAFAKNRRGDFVLYHPKPGA
jgi:peptidoglycan-associated lipoprotein